MRPPRLRLGLFNAQPPSQAGRGIVMGGPATSLATLQPINQIQPLRGPGLKMRGFRFL
jgi:hypothetical protein